MQQAELALERAKRGWADAKLAGWQGRPPSKMPPSACNDAHEWAKNLVAQLEAVAPVSESATSEEVCA